MNGNPRRPAHRRGRLLVPEKIEDVLQKIEVALAKTQALGIAKETLDSGL